MSLDAAYKLPKAASSSRSASCRSSPTTRSQRKKSPEKCKRNVAFWTTVTPGWGSRAPNKFEQSSYEN